jgi:spore coat polysaccharide biosynthesis predicted glycosyltransferase SpsG
MKTVAFYISNHGFGHASRNIPIIKKLLEINGELCVIIKTHTRQLDFMRQSLRRFSSRIAYYDENVDLGLILKENSPMVNKERLRVELKNFISTWDARITKEKAFLREKKVELVVSDIVPWVIKAASRLNIKSLLISNFTWAEIYRELYDEAAAVPFEGCYHKADHVFEYPIAGDMKQSAHKVTPVGMSCRRFDENAVRKIKSSFEKPLIFVSLGRSVDVSDEIEVANLPYDFIYTDGIRLRGKNAYHLPEDTDNTHDYIKASALIITKAGWSTVSEAICARKPMIVLSRPIKEDQNTIEALLRLKIATAMDFRQLSGGELINQIDAAKKLEENYNLLDDRYRDHSEAIAVKILERL